MVIEISLFEVPYFSEEKTLKFSQPHQELRNSQELSQSPLGASRRDVVPTSYKRVWLESIEKLFVWWLIVKFSVLVTKIVNKL